MSVAPGRASTVDYEAEVAALVARLRERDSDPAYADAPVWDTYARISRKYSRTDEDKTIRQTWRNLREMERRHVRLGLVLVDEARSAWVKGGSRPAWDVLLERIRARDCTGVVVKFVARIMRQDRDCVTLVDAIEETHGKTGRFVLVGDRHEYNVGRAGDNKRLRDAVSDAQAESDEKSERIRERNEDRLAEGWDNNGPSPFGHRWESERLSISDAQLETERAAVAWGYSAVVERDESWGYVANEWNSRGLTTRLGNRWDGQRVAQCLVLPRHAGLTRKGAKVHGRQADPSTAIVSPAMYERLMVKLDGRSKGRQPAETVVVDEVKVESPHFVSKSIRCGRCGYGMVGSMQTGTYADGTRRHYYKCPPKGCNSCGVDGRAAHTWAGAVVVRVLSRPDHAAMMARRDSRLRELAERIHEYETATAQLREEAVAIHVSRVAQLAEVRATIARYERELSPLLDERERLQSVATAEATPVDVDELIAKWNAATPMEKRRMVRLAMPDGFYVEPVGRGARIRGADILSRFSVERGKATPRRTDV
jgi:hypothetical protein